jgi:SpoVK/Ycf46/Vps4 family AAA+-type ATPase
MNNESNYKNISNSQEFLKELSNYARASCGVIFVKTDETYRLLQVLYQFCQTNYKPITVASNKKDSKGVNLTSEINLPYQFNLWTPTKGWQSINTLIPEQGEDAGTQILSTLKLTVCEETEKHIQSIAKGTMVGKHDYPLTIKNTVTIPDAFKAMEDLFIYDCEESLYHRDGTKKHATKHFTSPSLFVMPFLNHFINPVTIDFIKYYSNANMKTDRVLIAVVPPSYQIPEEIENEVVTLEFNRPSLAELEDLLDLHIASNESVAEKYSKFSEEEKRTFVENCLGMTEKDFENTIYIAITDNTDPSKNIDDFSYNNCIKQATKTKINLINKTGILELLDPVDINHVGGLDLLKNWLVDRKTAFSEDAQKFGIEMPKGMLVVGIPGNGKSLIAKACASLYNMPCIRFDIGKVFGSLVGQSESQMRKALSTVDAVSPCVLMIDEIDKGLAGLGGGGDNGVSSRVFGTLLTWLQERDSNKAPVFVIMTANDVTKLPPELMRKGRLDEIWAVGFPSFEERKQILKIHAEKRKHTLSETELEDIANKTDKFVGSELESIVKEGLLRSFTNGHKKLRVEDILFCKSLTKQLSETFKEKIEALQDWVESNARSASSDGFSNNKDVTVKPTKTLRKLN